MTILISPVRKLARISEPAVRVGCAEFTICMLSLSRTAWCTLEVKTVPCNSSHGFFHPRSAELLQARSASRWPKGCTRESPTASVCSVNGVGANTPVPLDKRRVQLSGSFTSVDNRGLKKLPYLLWKSARPLAEINMCEETGNSS